MTGGFGLMNWGHTFIAVSATSMIWPSRHCSRTCWVCSSVMLFPSVTSMLPARMAAMKAFSSARKRTSIVSIFGRPRTYASLAVRIA